MRRITRVPLDASVQQVLDQRQASADDQRQKGHIQLERVWKAARKTRPFQNIMATLKAMTGQRERCMYCLDSHGTDIEHFWPKTPYPERMFLWPNLLLGLLEWCFLGSGRNEPPFSVLRKQYPEIWAACVTEIQ